MRLISLISVDIPLCRPLDQRVSPNGLGWAVPISGYGERSDLSAACGNDANDPLSDIRSERPIVPSSLAVA